MRRFCTLLLAGLVGCSGGVSRPLPAGNDAAPQLAARPVLPTPIRHVVIIVQENRTVDMLFQGYPNADTQPYGYESNGRKVALQRVSLNTPDIDNSYHAALQSFDGGKMNGFDLNQSGSGQAGSYAYSYAARGDVAPYWKMAKEFVLADHMFPTELGQSWTSHLDLIAGTTNLSPSVAMVDFPSVPPWDCQAPPGTVTPTIDSHHRYNSSGGPFPCFTQFRTMADTLDAAHVSWRYYAPSITGDWIGGAWSSFSSIKNVRFGPDWKKVVVPPPTILTDVPAGKLAAVTWVTPDWQYSDHAGSGTTLGPSWVAAVVDTIGKSKFWKDTTIVVVWDDFGGWFDHVPPPQLDFRGLGIRVPCLIISPYVARGAVTHTQYEFGSILRYVEDTFGLPRLGTVADGYSDARATSLIGEFDFTRKPRPFESIPAPVFPYAFLHLPPSNRPPDE